MSFADYWNTKKTENGAITLESTKNPVLDFFFHITAMRDEEDLDRIINLFENAYNYDKLTTFKLLFYLRDIRRGQGERRLFRILLIHFTNAHPSDTAWLCAHIDIIPNIFGRWDDVVYLMCNTINREIKTACITFIARQLKFDWEGIKSNKPISLMAKWLPSENASNVTTKTYARILAQALCLSPRQYRQKLSVLRKYLNIVETNITKGTYDNIDYSKVPSKAHLKYHKAFNTKDAERYNAYKNALINNKTKVNSRVLYPYEIYQAMTTTNDKTILEEIWKNLPDYVDNIQGLVVADTSGSMQGRPMAVALSLAVYIGERNKCKAFKDCCFTFSRKAKFHYFGNISSAWSKFNKIKTGDCANTNLMDVFKQLLKKGVDNNIPDEEMPRILIIISDMEFDYACSNNDKTSFNQIKEMYKEKGYSLPNIVYWNVNSRHNHVDVTYDTRNVLLLSGCSPAILTYALNGGSDMMEPIRNICNSERYSFIKI